MLTNQFGFWHFNIESFVTDGIGETLFNIFVGEIITTSTFWSTILSCKSIFYVSLKIMELAVW